jgi:hypothetical protein
MPAAPDRQLARLRARFRQHAAALAPPDFVLKGSLIQRYLPCGTPSCRCHADPAQLHGPYWQWSTRIRGKTVTRMLTSGQAQRYQEWMKNGQRLDQILTAMHDISVRAAGLLSPKRASATLPKPSPRRTPPRKSTP